MKYLIAGLGNIGAEYKNTRHNIGFQILDALAGASNISFNDKRYGFVAEYKAKARALARNIVDVACAAGLRTTALLTDMNQVLGRNDYARLRFGIGDNFHKGFQVDYVLGDWGREEVKELPEKIDSCIEIINSFGTIGTERTMNFFNKK